MFVEGANYIAAECQVMMRGQGIMKIEAAEVTMTTSTTRYQEWRSWQPGHRMPHEGANTGIILAFRLLSAQTAEAFYVGDGERKKLSVRAELVQNRPGPGLACVKLHQTLSFCLLWHNITD